jgi:hypothetical protein
MIRDYSYKRLIILILQESKPKYLWEVTGREIQVKTSETVTIKDLHKAQELRDIC